MIDRYMQSLIDAPLANPNRVYLPEGRRPASRLAKPEYEGDLAPEKLTQRQLRDRRTDAHSAKIVAILDYYARTTVPFERIAEHAKLSLDDVREGMARRGRNA